MVGVRAPARMNPLRNWVLIGLCGFFALSALLWDLVFPLPQAILDPAREPFPEEVGLAFLWAVGFFSFLLAAVVCFVLWFALSNRDMNRVTHRWFLTPLWTLLLFVPPATFVGFYLMAQHIQRAQATTGSTGMHPVVLFVFMWLLPPIGVPLAQWQMQKIRPLPVVQPPPQGWTLVDEDEEGFTLHEETVVSEASPRRSPRVGAEVLPMPSSAVAASFFSVASLPLGLLGPAGLASSLAGLYARERFLQLDSREPGHRGGRVVSRLHWAALGGMVVSSVVSLWMLGMIFAT
jgi:hypothetical protein